MEFYPWNIESVVAVTKTASKSDIAKAITLATRFLRKGLICFPKGSSVGNNPLYILRLLWLYAESAISEECNCFSGSLGCPKCYGEVLNNVVLKFQRHLQPDLTEMRVPKNGYVHDLCEKKMRVKLVQHEEFLLMRPYEYDAHAGENRMRKIATALFLIDNRNLQRRMDNLFLREASFFSAGVNQPDELKVYD